MIMGLRDDLAEISAGLGEKEVLAQLAEECAELIHASLKMRRVLDGANPTPVPYEDAVENLKEEMADVMLCMMVLGFDFGAARSQMEAKTKRWRKRIAHR